jgi:hypothetical protein
MVERARATPAEREQPVAATRSLGLGACTAIVVGNMVESGFYLSPSAVAPYGLLAILACRPRIAPAEVIAFLFSMFTVYGCGPEPVLYGLVLLLGISVYVWQRRENAAVQPTPAYS